MDGWAGPSTRTALGWYGANMKSSLEFNKHSVTLKLNGHSDAAIVDKVQLALCYMLLVERFSLKTWREYHKLPPVSEADEEFTITIAFTD